MRTAKKNISIILLLAIVLLCSAVLLYQNNGKLIDDSEIIKEESGQEIVPDPRKPAQEELGQREASQAVTDENLSDNGSEKLLDKSQVNPVIAEIEVQANAEVEVQTAKAESGGQVDQSVTEGPESDLEGKPQASLLISCTNILGQIDKLDEAKRGLVPADGEILPLGTHSFEPGETVLDLLQRLLQTEKIHFDILNNPVYKSAYIRGINNIYEFDAGPLSGWLYRVNGEIPSYGVSAYDLEDGDFVELIYTLDLGKDIID